MLLNEKRESLAGDDQPAGRAEILQRLPDGEEFGRVCGHARSLASRLHIDKRA